MSANPTPNGVGVDVIRRGGWLALARSSDHALVFVAQVLVARWIGPDDFGAFATALLVLTIVDSATESGLAAALVHRDGVERRHLDVSWSVGILRGIVLGALIFATAPLVAGLAEEPAAESLIRWMAIVPILRALASPGLVTLQRSLAYRRWAVCSLAESAAMFVGTLVLVPVFGGAGALVGGVIVGEATRVVASYLLAPHGPRLGLDLGIVRELLGYGRWVTGSSVALLLLLYLDDVAVAGLLGAGALAVYQMAYQIAGVPASEISVVVGQVTFTAMARLHHAPERLGQVFLRAYELVAALAIPLAVGLAVLAESLVTVLLGPRWYDAVPVIRVLATWGVLRALGALTTSLFRAVGRPDIPARHHWRMVIGTVFFLVPLIELAGLVGAALAVLVPNLVIHWRRYDEVADVLEIETRHIVSRLLAPLCAASVMAVAMVAGLAVTSSASPWVGLAVGTAAGSVAYVLALGVLERSGRCRALHATWSLVRGAAA